MPLSQVVGKQLLCRIVTTEPQMYQVIGVAGHERHLSLAEPGREGVFVVDGTAGFGARADGPFERTVIPLDSSRRFAASSPTWIASFRSAT